MARLSYIQPDSKVVAEVEGRGFICFDVALGEVDGLHALHVYEDKTHVEWSDGMFMLGNTVGPNGLPVDLISKLRGLVLEESAFLDEADRLEAERIAKLEQEASQVETE